MILLKLQKQKGSAAGLVLGIRAKEACGLNFCTVDFHPWVFSQFFVEQLLRHRKKLIESDFLFVSQHLGNLILVR